jgi:hypothetical protein
MSDIDLVRAAGRFSGDRENEEFAESGGDMGVKETFHRTASEPPRQLFKAESAEEIAGEIERDGIHPDPHKRLAPRPPFSYVHDPVKRAEQYGTVTSSDQHIGRGPYFFNHGKLRSP